MKKVFRAKKFGWRLFLLIFEMKSGGHVVGLQYILKHRYNRSPKNYHIAGPFDTISDCIMDALTVIIGNPELRSLFFKNEDHIRQYKIYGPESSERASFPEYDFFHVGSGRET